MRRAPSPPSSSSSGDELDAQALSGDALQRQLDGMDSDSGDDFLASEDELQQEVLLLLVFFCCCCCGCLYFFCFLTGWWCLALGFVPHARAQGTGGFTDENASWLRPKQMEVWSCVLVCV